MLRSLASVILAISRVIHPTPPPDSTIAFVNVSVIPMDSERVLRGQTVVVRGGRIAALGPVGKVKVPVAAVRVDGRGRYLIPGLADMHAHLPYAGPASSPPDSILVTVTERKLISYLASGVTTIRNMAGAPWHVVLRAQTAKGELLSPRIYTSGPLILNMTTVEEAKRIVAEHKAVGYDFIKLHIDIYNHPLTREVFDSFVAAANRAGLRFAGHVPPGEVGLRGMLQAHPTSIEHLLGYVPSIFNKNQVEESEIPAIALETKRAGVWNCPTHALIMGATGDMGEEEANNLMRLQHKMIKALSDAGAGLLLGTDPNTSDGMTPTVVDELIALVAAGLTPYQALATGTRNVAVFFGTLDSTGTVTVGKRADLVLLEGNPLADVNRVASPIGVMLGGRWFSQKAFEARLASLKARLASLKARLPSPETTP